MECMIFIYLPPLFLSQIQIVASKLAEARYIPFGDQSTKTNNQNKHLFSAFNWNTYQGHRDIFPLFHRYKKTKSSEIIVY